MFEIINEIEKRLTREKANFIALLPKEIQTYIDEHSYFAGGCIYSIYNGKEPKDYDLFLDSQEAANMISSHTLSGITRRSKYAISLGQYQIITKFYGHPENVVSEFDFLHNMFYFYKGKVQKVASWNYLATNRLVFNENRARDICGAIMRIPKFMERGMTISKRQIANMLNRLDEGHFDERERNILKFYRHEY